MGAGPPEGASRRPIVVKMSGSASSHLILSRQKHIAIDQRLDRYGSAVIGSGRDTIRHIGSTIALGA